jgi:uncharacterized protein (DUF1778 family)
MTKKKDGNEDMKGDHINVRCSGQQKAMIEKAAKRDGVGASTWLLITGLRAAREAEKQL